MYRNSLCPLGRPLPALPSFLSAFAEHWCWKWTLWNDKCYFSFKLISFSVIRFLLTWDINHSFILHLMSSDIAYSWPLNKDSTGLAVLNASISGSQISPVTMDRSRDISCLSKTEEDLWGSGGIIINCRGGEGKKSPLGTLYYTQVSRFLDFSCRDAPGSACSRRRYFLPSDAP